jgi:NodT family efflux transporter outer membrane factor (OMF) lipoprotein
MIPLSDAFKYWLLCCTLLFSWSCSGTKLTPTLPTPQAWHENNTVSDAMVDHRWWLQFNDPILNDLIKQARQNSPDVKIAKARIAQARAQESATFAGQLPNITLGSSATRTRHSGAISDRAFEQTLSNNYKANFDTTWELNIFGLGAAMRGAKAFREKAEAEYDLMLVTLFGDVARHYFEIRKFKAQLAVNAKNIVTQKENVGLAEALNKAGQTSEADVAEAKALLSVTEATRSPIEQALKESYYQLQILLGMDSTLSLENLLEQFPPITKPMDINVTLASPATILAERADVRAAYQQLAYTAALHDTAVSHYFPQVSLAGLFGFESGQAHLLFKGASKAISGAGAISMPLFDFGRIRADVKETNAKGQEDLAQYEKTVSTALSEVEAALAGYANEQQHYKNLTASVEANQLSLTFAQERYKEGLSSYLNVTTAQKSMNDAEILQTDSLFEGYIQLVRLYKALGGGWKQEAATQTN